MLLCEGFPARSHLVSGECRFEVRSRQCVIARAGGIGIFCGSVRSAPPDPAISRVGAQRWEICWRSPMVVRHHPATLLACRCVTTSFVRKLFFLRCAKGQYRGGRLGVFGTASLIARRIRPQFIRLPKHTGKDHVADNVGGWSFTHFSTPKIPHGVEHGSAIQAGSFRRGLPSPMG